MKLAALVSGGKDSWLAVDKMKDRYSVEYLICVEPKPDSPFLHSENLDMVKLQSEASGIPLLWGESEDEGLGALEEAVERVKDKIDGIVSGAIASNYQKERVESICQKLDLECLTPLWKEDEKELMQELLDRSYGVVFTKVAAQGLDDRWLGRILDRKALEDLKELKEKYGIHIAGEGGEFETLVVDCPLFKKRLELKDVRRRWEGKTKTGYLDILDAEAV